MKAIQNPSPPPAPAATWPKLKAYVLDRLKAELPPDLYYHGIHHTRDDVLPAAERLAAMAELDPDSRLILATAALCHDVGFILGYQDHEHRAEGIVRDFLPDFGYSEAQVAEVIRLILATRVPQHPNDRLEALLCDADLDSLGRRDYLETAISLWRELRIYNGPLDLIDWYRRQIAFLSDHRYFTPEARALRDEGKAANVKLLERLLRDIETRRAGS